MRFTKTVAKKAFATINEVIATELQRAGIKDEQLIPGTFYMNGNDGSQFDWDCNDRTCEFMRFFKNEVCAIKVYIKVKNNKYMIDGYVFKTDKTYSGEHIKAMDTEINGDSFALWLQRNADNKTKYDVELAEIIK